MKTARPYWLEKLQVYVGSAIALAAVYLLISPALMPSDPLSPYTLAGSWGFGPFAAFAVMLLVVAAIGAAVTVSARPAVAMLVVFVAAGGVCLRSESIRPVLWANQSDLAGLYRGFVLELLLLVLVVGACAAIVGLVRRFVGSVRPRWRWNDMHANLTKSERQKVGCDAELTSGWLSYEPVALWASGQEGQKKLALILPAIFARSAACLAGGTFLSIVMLLITMRSGDRGQVLFAIFFSTMIGVMVIQKLLPTPWLAVAWIMPLLVGLIFSLLSATAVIGDDTLGWLGVPMSGLALPVDWFAAGGAGAMVGYWTSTRIHELQIIEAEV